MTPDQVHHGQADEVNAARQVTLDGAFSSNPERFVRKEPGPLAKPIVTWINPPSRQPIVQAQMQNLIVSESLTRSATLILGSSNGRACWRSCKLPR